MSLLETLGWSASFSDALAKLEPGFIPARVLEVQRSGIRVATEGKEMSGELSGRLRKQLDSEDTAICVGDWVAGELSGDFFWAKNLLPRRGLLARAQPDTEGQVQPLVANCDELWILSSCNQDFSVERLERYIAMGWDGRTQPLVILTKGDLPWDQTEFTALENRLKGVPVCLVSSVTGVGVPELRARLSKGKTIAFMGSSGVGKSTLVNALLGKLVQHTGDIREEDGKGRHTTTARSLLLSPEGACLIDTPGLRELALSPGNDLEGFADIEALATRCRFTNCTHLKEPHCAVQAALKDGTLAPLRLENYGKLLKEQAFRERKTDKVLASAERQKWKKISQDQKSHYNKKREK